MVENDRTTLELEGDIRLLYGLLERERRERKGIVGIVPRLERSVSDAKARIAQVIYALCIRS